MTDSIDNAALVEVIRKRCAGTMQYMVAVELGVSPTYLSDVLNGKRDISAELAYKLGYTRRVVFTLREAP